MKAPFKLSIISASLIVLSLLAAACSSSSTSGTSTSTSTTTPSTTSPSTTSTAAAALAPYLKAPTMSEVLSEYHWSALSSAPPRNDSLYYIYAGLGPGQIISAALRSAAQALHWKYTVLTYNAANPVTMNSAFLQAVSAGATAIESDGVTAAQVASGLAAAKAHHVQVSMEFDTDPVNSADNALFHQVGNAEILDVAVGKASALEIEAEVGKNANVAVVGTSGVTEVDLASQSLISGIQAACSTCTVSFLNVPATQFLTGSGNPYVVTYLRTHPKTNFLFYSYGLGEANTRAALNAAGFNKVLIGGHDPEPGNNAAIATGADAFWVQEPFAYVAWLQCDAFARGFTGGDPGIHNTESLPIWIVNKSNLNFNTSVLPNFPLGYTTAFSQLWRVSS